MSRQTAAPEMLRIPIKPAQLGPISLTARFNSSSSKAPKMAQFVQDTLKAIPGVDPRPMQRASYFSDLNSGPAAIASRIAGLTNKEVKDDSPYYTSNFGQLLPHSGHPLNVGGIPYQGDPLLLEKQQAFDRSKLPERIVHPAGKAWLTSIHGVFADLPADCWRNVSQAGPLLVGIARRTCRECESLKAHEPYLRRIQSHKGCFPSDQSRLSVLRGQEDPGIL